MTGRADTGEAKVYHRLGIVPRDPSQVPQQSGLARSFGGVVTGMRNLSLRRMGGQAIDLAPFGVFDYELASPFAEVVARVRDFHEVLETSDLRPASD